MQLAKQEALEAIGKLPDDVDMDEIMYRPFSAIPAAREMRTSGGWEAELFERAFSIMAMHR